MEDKSVAEKYAKSLFKVIEDPIIISQLKIIASLFNDRTSISDFFDKETVDSTDRKNWIEAELKSFMPQVKRLVEVLDENKRIYLLHRIGLEYEHLIYEKNEMERIYITTATEASSESLHKIVAHFEGKLQKSLRPIITINPDIIGGVTVQVEGTLYDDSIKSKLDRVMFELKKN